MKSKQESLTLCLEEADLRFNIATSKMSDITKRVHELEIQRNFALRKQFLENEMKNNSNNNLIKEYNKIKSDDRDISVYEEVVIGYRPMSRRKNELEEERNYYVKELEAAN